MIAYLDSSALMKLVIDEVGSDDVAALWDAADLVISSRVASPEVRAALAAAHRAARLTAEQLEDAKRLWTHLFPALHVVEVTPEVAQDAGDLAEHHGLSGFDAVHLASALLAEPTIIATWDRRLHTAAQAVARGTLPPSL